MSILPFPSSGEPRHCGACTACCTHLPIPAGEVAAGSKPAGIPCPLLGPDGCRSYADRPELCARFRCTWLADEDWPDGWRPDRSGLMCLREEIDAGLPAAVVYEITPGALEQDVAAAILAELRRTTAVVAVVDHRGSRQRLTGSRAA